MRIKLESAMIKSGLYNSAIAISGPMINFMAIPLATSSLGLASFGEASISLSVISYFTIVTSLGLSVYGTRELSNTKLTKKAKSLIFSELLILSVLASCAGALIFGLVAGFILSLDAKLIMIGVVALVAGFLNIEWIFYANDNYKTVAIRVLASRVIGLILIYYFVNDPGDIAVYVGIVLGSNIVPLFFLFRKFKQYTVFTILEVELSRHFKSIFSFLGIRVFSSVHTTLDIALVGFISGASMAGMYAIAIKVVRIATSVVCSATAVVLARSSGLVASNDKKRYLPLLMDTFAASLIMATFATIGLQIMAYQIVEFLGGKEYGNALPALVLMSFMVPVVSLSGFIGMQILYPAKQERIVANSIVIGSLVCITTMPLLLGRYGVKGAAMSVLMAETSILVVQLHSARVVIAEFLRLEIRRAIILMTTTTIFMNISYLIARYSSSQGLIMSLSYVGILYFLYVMALFIAREPLLKRLYGYFGFKRLGDG